ncbi:alpha/beta hydrolase domain-containing protein, partial [Gammaproteobacteria bacterium]|nr:alpha/beta hydrolase domain-containing protein [Gammaproteobacteria bacterium]
MGYRRDKSPYCLRFALAGLALSSLFTVPSIAEVVSIDVASRDTLTTADADFSYESIRGVVHFTLDPNAAANAAVVDLALAPKNTEGLVEYSADFKLLVPSANIASDVLYYNVNNRGGSRVPPEAGLDHPLSKLGYTYLVTGWINEISAGPERLRLHTPIVKHADSAITGDVRYEVIVGSPSFTENIAGSGHLAYTPTREGLAGARLTKRLYQNDARELIPRDEFELQVTPQKDANQPLAELMLKERFEPGLIYELIYEAQDPVLSGAGMTAIRDLVSLIRFGGQSDAQLTQLSLPSINHTAAWGISQSGRLLRQFVYEGFNADLEGRRVFDGVIPVIA